MEADKFKVDINKYLKRDIISGVDLYDFRNQDLETEEDIKHSILLCRELAYFDRGRLKSLNFKFDEKYFYEGQKPYSRIKVEIQKLEFIAQYIKAKLHGTLKRENVSYDFYKDAYEMFSDSLNMWHLKNRNKYIYGKIISQHMELIKKVIQTKKLLSCDDILEYGCGSGGNLIVLNRLYGEKRLSGFEYPVARYASALANFQNHGVELDNFFLADGRALPLRDNSFDLVFTCHVLEQLKTNLAEALNEVIRVARKGIVLLEPSIYKATLTERLYIRYNQLCENLIDLIKNRRDVEVIEHYKCDIRNWWNPSNFIVMRKR